VTDLAGVGAWLLAAYYLAVNLIYAFLFIESLLATLEHKRLLSSLRGDGLLRSPFSPPVSILVPARNEQLGIIESVESLFKLDYPEIEVIVINDGSTDATLEVLREHYRLTESNLLYVPQIPCGSVSAVYTSAVEPRLLVLDKESVGRKADALNAGLNAASGAYVCAIDGDAILESDSLRRIMAPALNDPTRVIASGGIVRAANGSVIQRGAVKTVRLPGKAVEGLQVLEYLRSFLVGRQGWARLNMLLIISGAFGVFRREVCCAVGGFRASAIGEDMDLVVRLHRWGRENGGEYKVAFVPDPVCWTEVPSTYSALASQRARWQNGLADTLWENRKMLLSPAYGRIGMIAMPYQLLFEFLAPLMEVIGWVALATYLLRGGSASPLGVALVAGYLMSVMLSVLAVLIEEMVYHRYNRWADLSRLVGYCFLEPLFYRPLNTIWRIHGIYQYCRKQNAWVLLPRNGFAARPGA
jgi:cellulose synthase/poly-beta-1,6-N-acetylglucosamine synthase-like glycosyltransferase